VDVVTFAFPPALVGLAVVPLVLAAYAVSERARRRAALRFAAPETAAFVVRDRLRWRRHTPAALLLIAVSLLAVAAARPHVERRTPVEQATVMLVLDVSRSMEATDVAPTRLAAAQAAVSSFLDVIPSSIRVGAVVFSGSARVVTPPTQDRFALEQALGAVETSQDTFIGDGLARSLESLVGEWERRGVTPASVLLLSDGRDTGSTVAPERAAAAAQANGVHVYTIAVGDPSAAPTAKPRPPDVDLLRRIALDSGGAVFIAPTAEELTQVYDELGSALSYERRRVEMTVFLVIGAGILAVAAAGAAIMWYRRVL
jgi:Ca-activated chloride channel family protein